MKDLIKKFEEQITFLQHEISQLSNEVYSQQKEIFQLKKERAKFSPAETKGFCFFL